MMDFISAVTSGVGSILGVVGTGGFSIVYNMFLGLFSLLPDGGALPAEVHAGAIYFGNTLQKVGFLVPVEAMVSCLIIILTAKMATWAFHVIRVIFNFVRGVGTERFDGDISPFKAAAPARALFD